MNNLLKYLLWFVISIVFLFSLIGSEIGILQDTKQQAQNNYEHIQQVILDKEAECRDLVYQVLQDTTQIARKWTDYLELAQQQKVIIHLFKQDTLVLWTDNTINSSKYLPVLKPGFFYLNTNNGSFLVTFLQQNSFKVAIFYQLKTNYQFQNQYIQNHINKDLSFLGSALFSPSPIQDFQDLFDRKGNYLCSIQIFGFPKITPDWLRLLIILTFGMSLILFHLLCKELINKHFLLGSVVFIGFTQLTRWLLMVNKLPVFLYNQKLFGPDIYASSIYHPSLGDFLISVLLLLWYFNLIRKESIGVESTKPILLLKFIFLTWLSMVLADAAFDSIKSLVFDSQISFDVKNIYSINGFTFLGILLAFLLLFLCYKMFEKWYVFLRLASLSFYEKFFVVGLVFFFLHPFLVQYLFERNSSYTFSSSILLFSFILYENFAVNYLKRFQRYFVFIMLLSVITSVTLYHYSTIEEEENRFLYAAKLVSQNDVNAEYFLEDIEKKIESEKILKNYFSNPIAFKSQMVKKLRQLYFSGYLGKYDITVYDYNANKSHYQTRNIYHYNQVNYIYQNLGSTTINQYFRFLKNNAYLKGYLGRFIVRNENGIAGYIFIHLQPKLVQDETRFDELLIDGFRNHYNRHRSYSFALYRDMRLLSQSGEYAYRTTFTFNDINGKSGIFEENGYSHLLFKENDQLYVVVSRKEAAWYEPLGLFSLSFTLLSFLFLIVIAIYTFFNNRWLGLSYIKNHPYYLFIQHKLNSFITLKETELSLIRTRIQLGILLIVFLTLGSTAYFTISFISKQNAIRQEEKLVKKLRSVVSAIENESQEINFNKRQSDAEASINQIADFYNTDITFFNSHGEMLSSTIKKVYTEGIVAPLMDAQAYYHLHNLRESQYVQQERIATFQYTGAYVPVFGKNRMLLGYVQLPNFYQNIDLNSEISSIIVGFINLYALLFMVIGIIAWLVSRNISYPLMLIQQQMAKTIFGKQNEPIQWSRNDEIGGLVQQYNLMIDQLAESAEKLAISEREGAWRDIARQIAHEIKNPLTPMKLSVQHLERAWKDQSPKLPETFQRVTRTLITQIDTLSNLATEFSSFAKMPAPQYEWIHVNNLLEELVYLQRENFDGEINYTCEEDTQLWFDLGYLNRTLTNLIKNACQAIPEDKKGKVMIEVYKADNYLFLEVLDNGTGISDEQKSKIFMPYFSTKVIGMGLGLPIVKAMIESGGGDIGFESKLGEGTRFRVRIPLRESE
ncbi:MAG: ATP-binding protein [Bacteroidia bacterium]|nr:ATP-binding protein [Bacteroidia bacterium]